MKFKVGDRIITKVPGNGLLSGTRGIVYYTGSQIVYVELNRHDFLLRCVLLESDIAFDQEYLNEKKMKKLLGVENE